MTPRTAQGAAGWLYFGCRRELGHYLIDASGRTQWDSPLGRFDGRLCAPEKDGLYLAALTRLGGYGVTAMAWWDRSVDRRPGSNSIIFAPSLDCSHASILAGAARFFPWVMQRLPQALAWHPASAPRPTPSDAPTCAIPQAADPA